MKTVELLRLHCSCVFAPHICDFVEQKRALGHKYNAYVEILNQFDKFCILQSVEEPVISAGLFSKWCEKRLQENDTTHHMRIQCLRSFAEFLRNNGVEAPANFHPLPRPRKTFMPYIFTNDEIRRFLVAVDSQCRTVNANSPIRHLVLPVLFRMLYTCGLRVSEALKLKVEDVDLQQGTLLVLDAKGGKDRLVAMSETMAALCREYRSNESVRNFESDYFFPAPDRGFYDTCTIYDRFRECLLAANIGHGGRGKGPRVHDLRHTFAVHVLNIWAAQGKDLYTCLPILSTYLGHKNLNATQQYLRLVPEFYSEVTNSFETSFGAVFPEVANEEL